MSNDLGEKLVSDCDVCLETLQKIAPEAPWFIVGPGPIGGEGPKVKTMLEDLAFTAAKINHVGPEQAPAKPQEIYSQEPHRRTKGRLPYAIGYVQKLRHWAQSLLPSGTTAQAESAEQPEAIANLSAKELAKRVGAPMRAVESFLRRYRAKFPDCYITTDSPRRNEPKYLYRLADVLPALKEHF